MKKHIRELKKRLEDVGIHVEKVEQTNGSHTRLFMTKGDAERIMIVSQTPSCHHACKNAVSTARKLFKQGG